MRYGNDKRNITAHPYTVVLPYGDFENTHHSMLCPLHLADALTANKGEFDMGFMVHESWPVDHSVKFDHIISQWRQINSPTHTLRIEGNRWLYNGILGREDLGPVIPGVRTDFAVKFRWREDTDGGLWISRDGKELVAKRGITIDPSKQMRMHWAVGIYRPWWNKNPLADGEPSFRRIEVWL